MGVCLDGVEDGLGRVVQDEELFPDPRRGDRALQGELDDRGNTGEVMMRRRQSGGAMFWQSIRYAISLNRTRHWGG